eukprot:3685554-Prymnesium_polylepis.1
MFTHYPLHQNATQDCKKRTVGWGGLTRPKGHIHSLSHMPVATATTGRHASTLRRAKASVTRTAESPGRQRSVAATPPVPNQSES